MTLNRSHIPFALFTALSTALAAGLYVANFRPDLLPWPVPLPRCFGEAPPVHQSIGGTPLGIAFGSIALFLFVLAAFLGPRKARPHWRVGTVRFWLRGHIWFTLLTIPLVLFHSGFRMGGTMTTLLVVLYSIVMISGLLGLVLQQFMPRMMREVMPEELIFEQIPFIRAEFLEDAKTIRNNPLAYLPHTDFRKQTRNGSKPKGRKNTNQQQSTVAIQIESYKDEQRVVNFLDHSVIPYLAASRGTSHPLSIPLNCDRAFQTIKGGVSLEFHRNLDHLYKACVTRRITDLQIRLHHCLHGWLFIHVPFSILLLVVTVWHAITTLIYS